MFERISKSNRVPFSIALVEDVGNQKDVPMYGTDDCDVRSIMETISLAAEVQAATGKPLSLPSMRAGKEKSNVRSGTRRPDNSVHCRNFAGYLYDIGAPEGETDISTMEKVKDELLALQGLKINFKNVFWILIKRFGKNYSRFFDDRTVVSLVMMLLEGRKIDSLLNTIKIPTGADVPDGRIGSNLSCGGSTGISGMDDF